MAATGKIDLELGDRDQQRRGGSLGPRIQRRGDQGR
jgi:hypothetical protein